MDLPHRARLDRHQRRRGHCCDGEGLRVDDLDTAAGDLERSLLGEVEGIALFLGQYAIRVCHILLLDIGGCLGAGEDEELAWRDVVE